jgi:hypothetical protein
MYSLSSLKPIWLYFLVRQEVEGSSIIKKQFCFVGFCSVIVGRGILTYFSFGDLL